MVVDKVEVGEKDWTGITAVCIFRIGADQLPGFPSFRVQAEAGCCVVVGEGAEGGDVMRSDCATQAGGEVHGVQIADNNLEF